MISLRNLTMEAGLMTFVMALAVSGAAAAQLGASAAAAPQDQGEAHAPAAGARTGRLQTSPRHAAPSVGMQAHGGPDSVVRPAAAIPPERIAVEPGARPVLAPQDDPRSVEEIKDLPAPTDR